MRTRSSILVAVMDTAPVSSAAVASSRPREAPEARLLRHGSAQPERRETKCKKLAAKLLLTLMVKLGFSGRALQLSARLVSSAAHGEITDGVVPWRDRAMHACELQLLHPQNALAKCAFGSQYGWQNRSNHTFWLAHGA